MNGAHRGMIVPNAWLEAARDPALLRDRSATKVYMWLTLCRLDPHEMRPVPLRATARELGLKADTLTHALRLLVARGYLVQRHEGRRGKTFRLMFNRIAPESAPNGTVRHSKP